MRVLSILSLLCLSALGVSSQNVMDATSTTSNWVITGNATPNPPLSLNAGSTTTFDVSLTTDHPFNFTTVATNTAVTSLDSTLYTVSGSAGCTANTLNGYAAAASSPAGTCIVTLKIASNAPAATIYYQCTKHPLMSGQITIVAAATTAAPTTAAPTTAAPTTAAPTTTAPTTATPTTASPTTSSPTGGNATTASPTTSSPTGGNATTASPTTASPTTAAPTTAAPTTAAPTTFQVGGTIVSNTFHITGSNSTYAYLFTNNGVVYANPTLQFTAGALVTFSFEFGASYSHPFGFSNYSGTDTIAASPFYFPDLANPLVVKTSATCDTTYAASVNSTIKTVRAINSATITSTNPCTVTIQTQSTDSGTVYYRCAKHSKMVGIINIVPGNGNSASTLTISGLTFIVTIIAAIMA